MSISQDPISRRRALALALNGALSARAGLRLAAAVPAVLAAGCAGDLPGLNAGESASPVATLGQGSVKAALILPLSGQGGVAATAASMRNAADLALSEFPSANVQVLVFDDGGTAEGGRAAARGAISQGAEIIIGPLLAPSVAAAGQVAKAAGRPVIAFSTDASVAGSGVYLMSFMPESDVVRVVSYTASQGRSTYAGLVPETPYGNVVTAALQQSVAARQGQIVGLERYSGEGGAEAAKRLAGAVGGATPQAQALFAPDGATLPAIGPALQGIQLNKSKVKLIGTSLWNDPAVLGLPILQGGWFAAPPATGFYAFSDRYRAKYGSPPARIASLSYDAVSLIAALEKTQGSQRFAAATLTNPSGFSGADGVFRFRPDGLNDRTLAVYEVRGDDAVVISPAPKSLGSA